MSLPLRITLRFLLTVLFVWALSAYLPQYFLVTGGLRGFVIIGALLTLLNLLVRPLLTLLTLPLRLFATIIAFILVNGAFLWVTVRIASMMDPKLVTLAIGRGIGGWIVVMILLGLGNWGMRVILR